MQQVSEAGAWVLSVVVVLKLPCRRWNEQPIGRQWRARNVISDCTQPENSGMFRQLRQQRAGTWDRMRTGGKGGSQPPHDNAGKSPPERALGLIRTAMIEKKITQSELADAADCHEKTIQNLMAGKAVRQQTLFDVCMVLGLDYEMVRATWSGEAPGSVAITGERPGKVSVSDSPAPGGMGGEISPVYMGAYTRAGVDHYVGTYLTLRPHFADPSRIMAYRTDIAWDPIWPSLTFEERDRPDAGYAHRGRVYIPASAAYIHLVSLTKGAMRMVMVSQPDRAGTLRGLIATQHKNGAMLVPVSTPIVYAQRADFAGVALGEIGPSDGAYGTYHQLLRETVEQGYARLLPVAGGPAK
jgi:DNA-binding Xre family transcriptional regulator